MSFHYEEKVLFPDVPVHSYGSSSTSSGLDTKIRREVCRGKRREAGRGEKREDFIVTSKGRVHIGIVYIIYRNFTEGRTLGSIRRTLASHIQDFIRINENVIFNYSLHQQTSL
jgi:hypothetical protein